MVVKNQFWHVIEISKIYGQISHGRTIAHKILLIMKYKRHVIINLNKNTFIRGNREVFLANKKKLFSNYLFVCIDEV